MSKRHSLYIRIVAIYVVCLVPLYLLVMFFFIQARSIVADQVTHLLQAEARYFMGRYESEVARIERQALDLLNDTDLARLMGARHTLTDHEYVLAMNRLQRRLTVLHESSDLVRSARVHVMTLDLSVNSGGGGMPSVSRLDDQSTALLERILRDRASSSRRVPVYYDADRQFIIIGEDPVAGDGRDVRYVIELELSSRSLKNSLSALSTSGSGGALLISGDASFFVADDDSVVPRGVAELAVASSSPGGHTVRIGGETYQSLQEYSSVLDMHLLRLLPIGRIVAPLRAYQIWTISVTSLIVALIGPFSWYAWARIRRPLKLLVESFSRMEQGDLSVRIDRREPDEFDLLFQSFNRMIASLRRLIDEVAEQRIAAQAAQIRQLQSQVNPHFLYNSYFMLHRLVKEQNWDLATRFSRMMGTYFKYITRSSTQPTPLSAELEHARSYADIQALRFAGRIEVDFPAFAQSVDAWQVPPMIVQPLIENAIVHGLKDVQRCGKLAVAVSRLQDAGQAVLEISVEDNGPSLSDTGLADLQRWLSVPTQPDAPTGLSNIDRRLRYMYPALGGLRLARSALGGLRVSFLISGTVSPEDAHDG